MKKIALVLLLINFGLAFIPLLDAPEPDTDLLADLLQDEKHWTLEFGLEWANTQKVSLLLNLDNGKAVCKSYVEGKTGTSSIHATYQLELIQPSGASSPISTWIKQTDGLSQTFESSAAIVKGKTYRFTASIKVTLNGSSETIFVTTPQKTY